MNGTIVYVPDTLEGGVAVQSCDLGFILEGVANRTCLANGEWETVDITCSEGEDIHVHTHTHT